MEIDNSAEMFQVKMEFRHHHNPPTKEFKKQLKAVTVKEKKTKDKLCKQFQWYDGEKVFKVCQN